MDNTARGRCGVMNYVAPFLTPELWAKVFAHLQELPDTISPFDDPDQKQNQAEVHQLKLVCKHFRDICVTDPTLVQRVYLDTGFSARALPSLLGWLEKSKSSVQIFQSTCYSPLIDAVLAVLASSEPSIRMVDVCNVSACSISLVAMFTRLEKCGLCHENTEELDLAPLEGLPRLSHLILQGEYKQLNHLAGLTRLECHDAKVSGVQEFPPTLQHLALQHSTLLDMHTQGLPACTALTHLKLWTSRLEDNNGQVYLKADLSLIPTDIGLLTKLHTLSLGSASYAEEHANVEWISQLASLQNLSMWFGRGHGQVLQHLPLLTKLTSLYIQGPSDYASHAGLNHVLDLDIDWHRLQALQQLSICQGRLHLGDNIADLVDLHQLRVISFAHIIIDSESPAAFTFHLPRLSSYSFFDNLVWTL